MKTISKIEKHIPIPQARGGSSNKGFKTYVYPWRRMQVGDSFLVKNVPQSDICSAAAADAKRNGVKYTVRRIPTQGVRVWRIQ